jgi:hypothetical protein
MSASGVDGRAQALFDEIAHDPQFVTQVAQRIRKEIPSYGLLTLEQVLGVGADWSRITLGSVAFNEHFTASGRARAHQGVPASEMMIAYRIFHQEMRRRARERCGSPDEHETLLEFMELSAAYVDAVTLATSEGHRSAELAMMRRAYHDRATVIRQALFGGSASAELRILLEALSVDLSRPFHAIRARPRDDTNIPQLEQILVSSGSSAHRCGLVAEIDGDVCGFVSALPYTRPEALVAHSKPVPLMELPSAFQVASRALTTGIAMGRRSGFVDLGDVALRATIMNDHEVGETLDCRLVAPLLKLGQAGRSILATVQCYLDNDGRLDATAKDLWVHANTVRYRLARYQEQTGVSLRTTEGAAEVWWALTRRRLTERDDVFTAPPDGAEAAE